MNKIKLKTHTVYTVYRPLIICNKSAVAFAN